MGQGGGDALASPTANLEAIDTLLPAVGVLCGGVPLGGKPVGGGDQYWAESDVWRSMLSRS